MLIPCFTVKAVIKVEHTETDPGQWQIFKLFGLKHLLISKKLEDDFQLFQLNEMSIKIFSRSNQTGQGSLKKFARIVDVVTLKECKGNERPTWY